MDYRVLLFYAGQLYGEYPSTNQYFMVKKYIPNEILLGGYLHAYNWQEQSYGWFRCDGTPLLDEDVPKQLKALLLLL